MANKHMKRATKGMQIRTTKKEEFFFYHKNNNNESLMIPSTRECVGRQ